MSILGLHYITAACSNAQRTVNFDAVNTYYLYFGDGVGSPGSLVTFFEWPEAPKGWWGIGTTHHLALRTATEQAQLKWKRWLTDHGVNVTGPYDRTYFRSIYVTDPDGLILEIATPSPGWTVDEPFEQLGTNVLLPPEEKTARGRDEKAIAAATWPEPVVEISDEMSVKRLHHISAMASDIFRTTDFYPELLGFKVVKRTVNFDDTAWPHLYFAVGDYSPGTVVTYFGYGPNVMRYGTIGTSLTQHMAFAVKDAEAQLEWREKLLSKDVQVTTVRERKYFTSISFNDPDGHILEIATLGPGFFVDENRQELGTHLMLPEWLEPQRSRIEQELVPHS